MLIEWFFKLNFMIKSVEMIKLDWIKKSFIYRIWFFFTPLNIDIQ